MRKLITFGAFGGMALWLAALLMGQPPQQKCVFDRNEIGPKGEHGQWWWDIYKCEDGTERRELVAGPRG